MVASIVFRINLYAGELPKVADFITAKTSTINVIKLFQHRWINPV